MGYFSMLTGAGNERNIPFARRVMRSVHSRNNPDMLRPDLAKRENTVYQLSKAQGAFLGDPYEGRSSAQPGESRVHYSGGAAAAKASLQKSVDDAATLAYNLSSKRKSLPRRDSDRPTAFQVNAAQSDLDELIMFQQSNSPRTYGIGDSKYGPVWDPNAGNGGAVRTGNRSEVINDPTEQTPGPVMRKAVLPAARVAGKAIGKTERAAKKVASKIKGE